MQIRIKIGALGGWIVWAISSRGAGGMMANPGVPLETTIRAAVKMHNQSVKDLAEWRT